MTNNGDGPSLVNGGAPDEAVGGRTKRFLPARKTRKDVCGVETTPTDGGIGGCSLTEAGKEVPEGS